MSSPSIGTNSSGSSSLRIRESSDDLQLQQQMTIVDVKKRKRMLSNRESARRSRMRKQKHLDDLMALVANLRAENHQILTNTNFFKQMHQKVESHNTVLRAQMSELNHRLLSLNDIVSYMSSNNNVSEGTVIFDHHQIDECGDAENNYEDFLIPDWSTVHVNLPMAMASSDAFMC